MAWKKVKHSVLKISKPKSIFTTKRVAVIAIILIVRSLFFYFIIPNQQSSTFVELTTKTEETNNIILSDGTKVWQNRDSKLIYPEKFIGKTRFVKLEGEAWFEVSKNPKKPFKVETKYSTLTVLGTTFNINTDSLKTEVCLATGKVNIESAYTNKVVNLLPNEKSIATSLSLTKSQITNPNYLSWKTRVFLFEDTPLSAVIAELNKHYKKPIILKTNQSDLLFSAHFDKTEQEDILEILKLTFNLSIEETPNFYEIH